MHIRPYSHPADEPAVIALWQACGLVRPVNDPHQDIARKLAVRPDLFLVGELATPSGSELIATAMVGYDGHRGWINYLGVAPAHQRRGHARALLAHAEQLLLAEGCPKLNLQVLKTNHAAIEFYRHVGYAVDDVLNLGKRLIPD